MILKHPLYDVEYVLTPNLELQMTKSVTGKEELLGEELGKAFQRGEDEGERQGYAKAREEVQRLSVLLHTIANHLIEHKKRLLNQLKPEVIEFALQIAELLVRHELSHPEHLLKLVHSLMNQAMTLFAGQPLTVFMAPEDLMQIESLLVHPKQGLHLVADPKLRSGDCRIEAATGLLNADVARELAMLKNTLDIFHI